MSGDSQVGKLVDVRHDARWWPGYVEAWRTKDGCWQVYVRFSVGSGVWHTAWVDAGDVRPAGIEVRSSESHRRELAAVQAQPEAPAPSLDAIGEPARRRTGVRALWVGSAVAGLFAMLAGVGVWLGAQEGDAGTAGDAAAQPGVGVQAGPSPDHGHHGPAVAIDEPPSPASRSGGATGASDLDDAIAGCERRWRLQHGPERAAQASLGQWRLHIVAMNRLMAGKITLDQANAFWDRTRLRAIRNVERFGGAYARYRANASACGLPRRTTAGSSRGSGSSRDAGSSRDTGKLHTCIEAAQAGDRVLTVAGRAIATWEHHVHDMMMLESGQITPSQAGRRWLAKWRAGNRQLERYEGLADFASEQRCT